MQEVMQEVWLCNKPCRISAVWKELPWIPRPPAVEWSLWHTNPCPCSRTERGSAALLPVPLWVTISPQPRNGLLPKTNNQNTTEKQLPGVTVERSSCWRRQNRFQLQKYYSLRKQKLTVLNSLHKKYLPFFLTCIWLISTYSTIYVACIRKCNDC